MNEYNDYPKMEHEEGIPHQVVREMIRKEISRIRAWREYLGLTQQEVAEKVGISQAGYSQMEAVGARPRKATLAKLSEDFGITIEQLK